MNPVRIASRSEFLCAEAGTRAAAPFPAPLSPLAASILRFAPDTFLLTKPNTLSHNRVASVATLRWCSGSSRNAVRLPFGNSVRLRRNPHNRGILGFHHPEHSNTSEGGNHSAPSVPDHHWGVSIQIKVPNQNPVLTLNPRMSLETTTLSLGYADSNLGLQSTTSEQNVQR